MAFDGSVSGWIDRLKEGDAGAAQQLWERYFQRLVPLARRRLQAASRRAADEEDVALSAFDSFCRGAEAGRFPQLFDRDSLWKLLVVLTIRKAARLVRYERQQKRRGDRNISLSEREDEGPAPLDQILSHEPTPEFAVQVAEQFQHLLTLLGEAELIRIVSLKMEGYTNEEIAAQLDCTPRTVQRKLRIIQGLWEKEDVL